MRTLRHYTRRDVQITEHVLGADVEELNDALGIRRNTGEIGAAEDGLLQGAVHARGFLSHFGPIA